MLAQQAECLPPFHLDALVGVRGANAVCGWFLLLACKWPSCQLFVDFVFVAACSLCCAHALARLRNSTPNRARHALLRARLACSTSL